MDDSSQEDCCTGKHLTRISVVHYVLVLHVVLATSGYIANMHPEPMGPHKASCVVIIHNQNTHS